VAAGGACGGRRRLRRQAALAAAGGARLASLTVGTSMMAAADRQQKTLVLLQHTQIWLKIQGPPLGPLTRMTNCRKRLWFKFVLTDRLLLKAPMLRTPFVLASTFYSEKNGFPFLSKF